MRSTKYTRDVLAPVVAKARSLSDVIRAFGLRPSGGLHRQFTALIAKAKLSTSHFTRGSYREVVAQLSRERLLELLAGENSLAAVLARLELPLKGRAHHDLKQRLRELAIDTSHLRGAGWSRGETRATHPSVERLAIAHTISDADVFCLGSLVTGPRLLSRLLRLGWDYKCDACSIADWRGQQLRRHVDHINGVHHDNRFENLRLLCPNCHSQTPTYAGSKNRRVI